ncbi:MAG TPA: hypothetical protein VGF95_12720 [Solirubrobacteraceae bacterium]|jgi:hypothetical protein
MRLRVALAAALLCVIGLFVLEMSGAAPRSAGTNHVPPLTTLLTPKQAKVCQSDILPAGAGRVKLLVGAYGHRVPALAIGFRGPDGKLLSSGRLPAGAPQGFVLVPLRHPYRGADTSGTLCLSVDSPYGIGLGGEPIAPGPTSAQLNGKPEPTAIIIDYLRPGRETWWQLLPTLTQRFAYGKAAFFGTWTLPVAALLLLGAWIAAIRLLWREAS